MLTSENATTNAMELSKTKQNIFLLSLCSTWSKSVLSQAFGKVEPYFKFFLRDPRPIIVYPCHLLTDSPLFSRLDACEWCPLLGDAATAT